MYVEVSQASTWPPRRVVVKGNGSVGFGGGVTTGDGGATVYGHGWYLDPVFVPVEEAISVVAPLLHLQ